MFRDGRAVKAHMKAHSEPNTIHCELCGKAFSLRAAYANHVKIHDPNSSGRARRRYRRVFPPNPVRKPLPIPPPPLPEPRSASPPPPLIHHPPPEVEEFTMETEEEGTDSAVKCPACLVPLQCQRMWSHMQRHVQQLMQVCEDTSRCLEDYEAVLQF